MAAIVITGASGRMGRALIETAIETKGLQLAGATVRVGSNFVGLDAGELIGRARQLAPIRSSLSDFSEQDPVVIDFTTVEASLQHLTWCVEKSLPCVIGTTGFSVDQEMLIQEASHSIPIVLSPNFSVGVNVVFDLLNRAARIFGDSVDIEVLEAHHRHKVDSPSGTALAMGRIVADVLDRDLNQVAIYGREGQVGARPKKQIGFSTVRAGDIVGEHSVMFAGEGERVEITHKASSRRTFANGAMRAALWASEQDPGLYSMRDVLGL